MTQPTMHNWRRIVGQRIRRLTPDQAKAVLANIRDEDKAAGGATIFHPAIRALTGGLNSQSLNHYVVRKLAEKAGIVRK